MRAAVHGLAALCLLAAPATLAFAPSGAPALHRRGGGGAALRAVLVCEAGEFESIVLKADGPVVVDFCATWCGPCKLVEKHLRAADEQLGDAITVVKVDIDINGEVVKKYNVAGLPKICAFLDGKMVGFRDGAIGKEKFAGLVKQSFPSLPPLAM